MQKLAVLLVLVFGTSCAHHGGGHKKGGHMSCEGALAAPVMSAAVAIINPLGKNKPSGKVKLFDSGSNLTLLVTLSGLKPNSTQGFHIHETGNCSSADGSSAGGHFNPKGMPHGAPTDPSHHLGDLGNVVANAKGEVVLEVSLSDLHVRDVVGRSFILHSKADDLKSQPAGAAGDRIACGVIGYSP